MIIIDHERIACSSCDEKRVEHSSCDDNINKLKQRAPSLLLSSTRSSHRNATHPALHLQSSAGYVLFLCCGHCDSPLLLRSDTLSLRSEALFLRCTVSYQSILLICFSGYGLCSQTSMSQGEGALCTFRVEFASICWRESFCLLGLALWGGALCLLMRLNADLNADWPHLTP